MSPDPGELSKGLGAHWRLQQLQVEDSGLPSSVTKASVEDHRDGKLGLMDESRARHDTVPSFAHVQRVMEDGPIAHDCDMHALAKDNIPRAQASENELAEQLNDKRDRNGALMAVIRDKNRDLAQKEGVIAEKDGAMKECDRMIANLSRSLAAGGRLELA
ncbi:hypothetical protein BAUCODRAFT_275625 [Baudoinia panamericana UAMH 10762]|uniref:Uncharacterized protein n=1 Tax=Baudoinia panamericana (strain UAMH 10762) TaxID=717646 RepID=M2MZH5_BAUPA|nr:uncharacterized protein BAUCODRAFT_275625 [Baudoinia panamericana UAMH 10762]EMC92079.1 hypothetical protein BAUCODRAFT_275625 [Baudoinia panamericana UAMH 10762]